MKNVVSNIVKVSLVLAFSVNALAQVEVVESRSLAQQQAEQARKQQQASEDSAAKANAQLFYQLQLLQKEVMQMRGTLEEQAHQIQQLKQQRLDDYVNLDKRIAGLAKSGPSNNDDNTSAAAKADNSADDKQAYTDAYQKIKSQDYPAAKQSFSQFLNDYPESIYRPNAYYWLGELHLLDKDYNKAGAAFDSILSEFPTHRKYPEALYKKATIAYYQGDKAKAKQQLENVVAEFQGKDNNAVRLAREFLQKHYP